MKSQNIDNQLIELKGYQKENRLKTEELAEMIGVSVPVLYKLYQGKLKLQSDVSKKIRFLLDESIKSNKDNYVEERKITYKSKQVEFPKMQGKVPYFDIDVTAGNVQLFSDYKEYVSEYYSVPKEIQDVDFCFRVRGDSMYDKILPGAIVFVKQITDISIIEFGQVFVVITAEQRMVKYVRRHPTNPENMVLLRSHNNQYDDIDLAKNKITNLLLVKGYLNNYVL